MRAAASRQRAAVKIIKALLIGSRAGSLFPHVGIPFAGFEPRAESSRGEMRVPAPFRPLPSRHRRSVLSFRLLCVTLLRAVLFASRKRQTSRAMHHRSVRTRTRTHARTHTR